MSIESDRVRASSTRIACAMMLRHLFAVQMTATENIAWLQVSFRHQQLCIQNRGAGCSADGVVTKRDESVIEHPVFANAADGHAHAAPRIAVETRLRPVLFIAN